MLTDFSNYDGHHLLENERLCLFSSWWCVARGMSGGEVRKWSEQGSSPIEGRVGVALALADKGARCRQGWIIRESSGKGREDDRGAVGRWRCSGGAVEVQ